MAAADLTEFYRQLHLLTQSNLPLPESLRQLADNARRPAFRRVLADLAEQTAGGRPLAAAMAAHPHQFDPSFVRMIAASEAAGTLPETLAEIAGLAAIYHRVTEKTRNIAILPTFTIFFAALITLGLLGIVVPNFIQFFHDLFEEQQLPDLTNVIFTASRIVSGWLKEFMMAYVVLAACAIWLFSGTVAARRQLLALIHLAPFGGEIFRNLQMAQVCLTWSALSKLKMSMPEIFSMIADLVEDSPLRQAMRRLADRTGQGMSSHEALTGEPTIPKIMLLVVRYADEAELPGEFAAMANIFYDQSYVAASRAESVWELALIVITSIIVGGVVTGIFAPLIEILKLLGS